MLAVIVSSVMSLSADSTTLRRNIFKGITKEQLIRQQTLCIQSITVSEELVFKFSGCLLCYDFKSVCFYSDKSVDTGLVFQL